MNQGKGKRTKKPRKMTILKAKLNCDLTIFSQSVSQAMESVRGILLDNRVAIHNIEGVDWAFVDNTLVKLDGREFIAGRLCRRIGQPSLDLQDSGLASSTVPSWTYANFVLDLRTEYMTIEVRKYISLNMFIFVFPRLLHLQNPYIGNLYINPMIDVEDSMQRIAGLSHLKRIEFTLKPPNYNDRAEMERLLAVEFTDSGAATIKKSYANPDGLKKSGTILDNTVRLISKYGSFIAHGLGDNGAEITIKSEESLIKSSVTIVDEPEMFVREFSAVFDLRDPNEH